MPELQELFKVVNLRNERHLQTFKDPLGRLTVTLLGESATLTIKNGEHCKSFDLKEKCVNIQYSAEVGETIEFQAAGPGTIAIKGYYQAPEPNSADSPIADSSTVAEEPEDESNDTSDDEADESMSDSDAESSSDSNESSDDSESSFEIDSDNDKEIIQVSSESGLPLGEAGANPEEKMTESIPNAATGNELGNIINSDMENTFYLTMGNQEMSTDEKIDVNNGTNPEACALHNMMPIENNGSTNELVPNGDAQIQLEANTNPSNAQMGVPKTEERPLPSAGDAKKHRNTGEHTDGVPLKKTKFN